MITVETQENRVAERSDAGTRRVPPWLIIATGIAIILSGCTSTGAATTSPQPSSPVAASPSPTLATPTPTGPAGNGSTAEPTPAGSTATAAPTNSEPTDTDIRSAFITAADAVCADAQHQLDAIPAPTGPTELADTLTADLQVEQNTLTKLQTLSPPEEDRAEITARLLNPYQQAIVSQQSLLPVLQKVIASGDTVQLANMHTEYDTTSHPQAVADFVRDYGFQACQMFDYFRTR